MQRRASTKFNQIKSWDVRYCRETGQPCHACLDARYHGHDKVCCGAGFQAILAGNPHQCWGFLNLQQARVVCSSTTPSPCPLPKGEGRVRVQRQRWCKSPRWRGLGGGASLAPRARRSRSPRWRGFGGGASLAPRARRSRSPRWWGLGGGASLAAAGPIRAPCKARGGQGRR